MKYDYDKFDFYYGLANEYYEKNNNLIIPRNYKIKDNNRVIKLGKWITNIRDLYSLGKLDEEQIKMLNKIGMVWTASEFKEQYIDKKWLRKYELAKKYYEEHKSLDISEDYMVSDLKGNVVKLGAWLKKCIFSYALGELTKKQITMLEEIGVNWNMYQLVNFNYVDEDKTNDKKISP